MKNVLVVVLFLCFLATSLIAQEKNEGEITYDVKVNMHRRISEERAELKNRIPEFQNFRTQLLFNANTSFYTLLEDEEEDGAGRGRMRMFMRSMSSDTYLDFSQELKIESREILGKQYLIKDTLKAPSWKLTDETQTVNGLVCRKAILEITAENPRFNQNIVAWYADNIFLPIGPDKFHSLPGTILHVDVNDGEVVITATALNFRPLKKNELKEPKGGKEVTSEEFRKEMQEIRKQNPNGARMFGN